MRPRVRKLRKTLHFQKAAVTPKAFANVSPGLERSDNPGYVIRKNRFSPERLNRGKNPFKGFNKRLNWYPKVVAALQPWAEISERFRRYFNTAT